MGVTTSIDRARATVVRVVAITVLLFVGVARADKIDDLINDLGNSSDRVRITAVLALTNQASPRAIPALVNTLQDTNETSKIRGLAAAALGRTLATGNPNTAQTNQAVAALTKAEKDPDNFVSSKAQQALSAAGTNANPQPTSGGTATGVYVNIGPMSSKTNSPSDPTFRAAMVKVAGGTLGKIASNYKQTWAGGGTPTKPQLQQKKIAGFYVDGTLNTVTVNKSGNSATVTCKVSMLLADFPDKSVFGFLNGNANVQGAATQKDIDLSTKDCVEAVIESLITKQIVPTIKTKSGVSP